MNPKTTQKGVSTQFVCPSFMQLASQAEEAAGQGNLKDLYMLTRKLSGKFQQSENMPIRN